MSALAFTTTLPETLLILWKIQRASATNVRRSSCKVPVILLIFVMKLELSLQIFEKKNRQTSNLIKIRPVGAEVFHADRLFAIFRKAQKKKPTIIIWKHSLFEEESAFRRICNPNRIFFSMFTVGDIWSCHSRSHEDCDIVGCEDQQDSKNNGHFGRACCLHLHVVSYHEDGKRRFLWNVGTGYITLTREDNLHTLEYIYEEKQVNIKLWTLTKLRLT